MAKECIRNISFRKVFLKILNFFVKCYLVQVPVSHKFILILQRVLEEGPDQGFQVRMFREKTKEQGT